MIMKSIIRWDPFRAVRAWDPLDEMRIMHRDLERLFDRLAGTDKTGEVGPLGLWMPPIESYTKDGKLFIKAELPGVDAKDLDVTVDDHELVIKGERKTEKDEKEKDYSYREISYGSFERRFMIPEGVRTDDLKAAFANGILEISLPIPEVPKAKKIEIKTEESKKLNSEATFKKAA
jgi:HSP20 family protein